MKIMQIVPSFEVGGAETMCAALSRQLLLEKVGHVLKRLPEKEQAVVEGVYLNDVEQKHLAKSLDISLPYVYRLQKRGIRRVRGMLSRFIHENRQ